MVGVILRGEVTFLQGLNLLLAQLRLLLVHHDFGLPAGADATEGRRAARERRVLSVGAGAPAEEGGCAGGEAGGGRGRVQGEEGGAVQGAKGGEAEGGWRERKGRRAECGGAGRSVQGEGDEEDDDGWDVSLLYDLSLIHI